MALRSDYESQFEYVERVSEASSLRKELPEDVERWLEQHDIELENIYQSRKLAGFPVEAAFSGAENGIFQGNIESKNPVLTPARKFVVDGDIDAVETSYRGSIPGNVLKDAAWSAVFGDVEGKYVLKKAIDSAVYGDVVGQSVLGEAEQSAVYGDVEASQVLTDAEQSLIIGDIHNAGKVLWDAMDSVIRGNVDGKQVLSMAKRSTIDGDIIANEVMENAEQCQVYGNVVSKGVLYRAEESVIVSKRLVTESIGEGAESSLVAAALLDPSTESALTIDPNIDVITAQDGDDTTQYTGNWEELERIIDQYVAKHGLEPFRLFSLRTGELSSMEELSEALDEVRQSYEAVMDNERVEDELALYHTFEDLLDLPRPQASAEYAVTQLERMPDIIGTELRSHLDVSLDTARQMLAASHPKYLTEHAERMKEDDERYGIIDIPSMDTFLKEFQGGSTQYTASDEFSQTYHISTTDHTITEKQEQLNQELRTEAIELLADILDGKGQLHVTDKIYQDHLDTYTSLGEHISELYRRGETDKADKLRTEKHKLEESMAELRQDWLENRYGELGIADYESGSLATIREGLSQLAQEYLEDCQAKHEAEQIVDRIELGAEDLGANTVRVEAWDKDLRNMPDYETYNGCIFPGFGNGDFMLLDMMTEEDTQFLNITAGDKNAIAITRQMQDTETGENYLVVNSVESASNVLKRESVTTAVDQGIQEYAASLDMDAVVYNPEPRNTAPKQFVNHLTYDTRNVALPEDPSGRWQRLEAMDGRAPVQLGDEEDYGNWLETETGTASLMYRGLRDETDEPLAHAT